MPENERKYIVHTVYKISSSHQVSIWDALIPQEYSIQHTVPNLDVLWQ